MQACGIKTLIFIMLMGLGLAGQARALAIHGGSSSIGLNLTLSGGLSLLWASQYDRAEANAAVAGVGSDQQYNQAMNWTGVLASASVASGDGLDFANASASTGSTMTQSYSGQAKIFDNDENATAGRFGSFWAVGSGDLTITGAYNLAYSIDLSEAGDWARTSNFAGLQLQNFDQSLLVSRFDAIGEEHTGVYQTTVSKNGLFTATLHFNDRERGALGVGVGDSSMLLSWGPTAPPPFGVPEPGTLMLMGAGWLGLLPRVSRRTGSCRPSSRMAASIPPGCRG